MLMKKISPKSYFIGLLSGILLTLTGLFIAYYTDSKRVEIAEVVDSIPVDTFMYVTITDTAVLLHPDIQYRKEGQKPRQWNRELYYSDMDSITVAKWNSLSSKERVKAIRKCFLFDSDVDWDSYTDEEQEKMLLDNSYVEWE